MRYLNFILLTVFAFALISRPGWASASIGYKAGQMAFMAEYCGRYDLNVKLYRKYGHHDQYQDGELSLDMYFNYGNNETRINPNTSCEIILRDIRELLAGSSSVASNTYSSSSANRELCNIALARSGTEWENSGF